MTDAAAGLTRLLPGRLPLSMSLSLVTHALAALVVGALVTAHPPSPRAQLESMVLTVTAMQPPRPPPVPVDIEPPPPPTTRAAALARSERPVARPMAARALAPAAPTSAAPTPAASAPAVLDSPLAAGPAVGSATPSSAPGAGPPSPAPVAAAAVVPQTGVRGAPGPMVDVGAYLSVVRDRVSRHRRYPTMAIELGLEGVVEVGVRINPDGSLAAPPTLDESCGHELLDAEALRIVALAAPFPPVTGHQQPVRLRVPVHFHLD
ncbi:MAG: energy transducer TonB [Deltaproteobacteria bacterium]|nr:energy transducer TonB [Deltaproteobacteria bacterium]MBP6833778.1 energy transducer TonB [Deltaproteobacteria bacterium]